MRILQRLLFIGICIFIIALLAKNCCQNEADAGTQGPESTSTESIIVSSVPDSIPPDITDIMQDIPDTLGLYDALNNHVDAFISQLNSFTDPSKSKEEKEEEINEFEQLFDSSTFMRDSIIQVINVNSHKISAYSIHYYASSLINKVYRGARFSKHSLEVLSINEGDYQKYDVNAKVGQVYKGRVNYDLTEKVFYFMLQKDGDDNWTVKILKITVDKVYDLNKKSKIG